MRVRAHGMILRLQLRYGLLYRLVTGYRLDSTGYRFWRYLSEGESSSNFVNCFLPEAFGNADSDSVCPYSRAGSGGVHRERIVTDTDRGGRTPDFIRSRIRVRNGSHTEYGLTARLESIDAHFRQGKKPRSGNLRRGLRVFEHGKVSRDWGLWSSLDRAYHVKMREC